MTAQASSDCLVSLVLSQASRAHVRPTGGAGSISVLLCTVANIIEFFSGLGWSC